MSRLMTESVRVRLRMMADTPGFQVLIDAVDTVFKDIWTVFRIIRILAGHGFAVTAILDGFDLRRNIEMSFILPDDALGATSGITWVDRFSDPGAAPPSDAAVSSSDPTLFDATLINSNTAVHITPSGTGKLGVAQVQLVAPSRSITITADIEVVAGSATGAGFTGFAVDSTP